jgi:sugar lactone lactonase YvrE
MNIFRFLLAAALIGAPLAFSVETRSWTHNDQQAFEKGTLRNVSLRSDGTLTLAPVFQELADPSAAYLWALAVDARGNLYTGGGSLGSSTARLTAIDASGKSRTLAEIPGLQIQAVAVDRNGRVFAATSPDGKVYRIAGDGKPEVFYDPKAKYIWAMAFDSHGNLFVATGDKGEIHRVTPSGQGALFFQTEETHARSLAVDAKDNLIVGTEPGGLVMRISSSAEGFVLHQSSKREVIAVGVSSDGTIYAAAAGNRTAGSPSTPSSTLTPAPAQPSSGSAASGAPPAARRVEPVPITGAPSAPAAPPAAIAGGSEVYRIGADGYPQRVWAHPQDVVYGIAFDGAKRPILGTGNKGNIYRLDTDLVSTLLINAAPAQVTALASGPNGRVYAATGNVGKVYAIGPELAPEGNYVSDPLDAGSFAFWGSVRQRGTGSPAKVETRSGNLDRPQKNWSSWAPLDATGRIASPPARFLQYRLKLAAPQGPASQSVREIDLAWMPKNVAPVLEELEITPPNYRFNPPSALSTTPTQTITLPALGQRRRPLPSISLDSSSTSQTMQFGRGHIGARWAVTDPNGDGMIYKVEIRGAGEKEWKLLRDKVKEKYLSWESNAWPDGDYQIRVTASDEPDNPPASALTSQLESELFTIDNTAPQISGLTGSRTGDTLVLKWTARDDRSVISRAEYSVNGRDWILAEPATRLSDAPQLEYSVSIPTGNESEIATAVRVTDEFENTSVEKVVVR